MDSIVYFCGSGVEWDPTHQNLGGSETAVVQLTKHWSIMGYKCFVFANVNPVKGDTTYYHYKDFKTIWPTIQPVETLIVWRTNGLIELMRQGIELEELNCRKLWDLHDIIMPFNIDINHICKLFDNVMIKSSDHIQISKDLHSHNKGLDNLCTNNFRIIPNGVLDIFFEKSEMKRQTLHFCYASCWSRGLHYILKYLWPQIRKAFPCAMLHAAFTQWCQPRDQFTSHPVGNYEMQRLLDHSPGVINYGRVNINLIREIKTKCLFHLMPISVPAEIDCISIKESAVCGCIPLLADWGVFKNRAGIKLNSHLATLPDQIIDILKELIYDENDEPRSAEVISAEFQKNNQNIIDTYIDWEGTARAWTAYL